VTQQYLVEVRQFGTIWSRCPHTVFLSFYTSVAVLETRLIIPPGTFLRKAMLQVRHTGGGMYKLVADICNESSDLKEIMILEGLGYIESRLK
jgi:hypothetical protein